MALPVLALVACGETRPQPESRQPNELVVTRADGTTFKVSPDAVDCGPSEYDPKVQVVRIHEFSRDSNLLVEVVPGDVAGGKTFDLPVSAGGQDVGPANAFVFLGTMSELEVSSSQEESTGTLDVARASCDPVALEMTIDATLDSEYYDGESLDVRGHVDLPEQTSPEDEG